MYILRKKTRKILAIFLTICALLNTQDFLSLAEGEQSESLSENNIREEKENPPDDNLQKEKAPEGNLNPAVSENNIPKEPVSGNDLPEKTVSGNSVSQNSVSQNSISENSISENSLFRARRAPREGGLSDEVLKQHTVKGLNPEQAVVTLFDYWKDEGEDGQHSPQEYVSQGHNYHYGISRDHMLIFGWFEGFGSWNNFKAGQATQGMVQKKLGEDECPVLDFSNVNRWSDANEFYKLNPSNIAGDGQNYKFPEGFPDAGKEESLAYLFSAEPLQDNPSEKYRKIYNDVRGLFQRDKDGYYYYDSTKNFAEYDERSNSFILYDSPGVSGGDKSYGQFFPFNKGSDVFDTVEDGKLKYRRGDGASDGFKPCIDNNYGGVVGEQSLNHYLGFTLEVPFLQPTDGKLPEGAGANGKDMEFTFSGDDDVWIFIDDVLVADLGGMHGARGLSINFATGDVSVENYGTHTILSSFQDAYGENSDLGGVQFQQNTFADNTAHKLKMFYMERGHTESNLSLRFNLQLPKNQKLRKVNQEGDFLDGASFVLYPAEKCDEGTEGSLRCTSTVSKETIFVKQDGDDRLAEFIAQGGQMEFIGEDGNGFRFDRGSGYYILKETNAPGGYRRQPVDIVLEYNRETGMISVANRWTSGAYASFTSYVYELKSETTYGAYREDGFVEGSDVAVSEESRANGLVLAVPMVRGRDGSWLPLYGSNTGGFHTVGPPDDSPESMRRTLLNAALHQCLYEDGWYLEWDGDKKRLEGELNDLPGRADRYRHVNPDDFDMRMMYVIIESQAFVEAGIEPGSSSEERYENLKEYVNKLYGQEMEDAGEGSDISHAADLAASAAETALYGVGGDTPGKRNVSMMDTSQFLRVFRSLLYVSNEQRELRVQKVDEDGNPINGALFGLYTSEEAARAGKESEAAATGVTANIGVEGIGKSGMDGMLVIRPQVPYRPDGTPEEGYVPFSWVSSENTKYYLREISAPEGYEVNTTVIPVVVGIYSIYADAGSADDGVSVKAGVGQLYHTMKKYASDGDVNVTLRDIKAVGQTQPSENFGLYSWNDQGESMNLHYGINLEQEMDYGRHDSESGLSPFLETETGFLRTRVEQNTDALANGTYGESNPSANWDHLEGEDLTGLFSLLNIVVVENEKTGKEDPKEDPKNPEKDPKNPGTVFEGPPREMTEEPTTAQAGAIPAARRHTPQTGDDSHIWWWALMAAVSLAGICAAGYDLYVKRKKRGENKPDREEKSAKQKK